jgi:RNA 3'-terminal phosphate cyclase (ATP)
VEPVEIDGSHGEGGGQILRTSLALAILTRRPLVMRRIRAGRAKPGLRRQHLTCVEAAAALCNARVRGASVGSQHLELFPGEPTEASELAFDIGTAGSTTLVIQTIVVPAIVAGRPLRVTVDGGTHNPMAPPFDFLARVFVPHLRAMGADVTLTLERHGFASGPASPGPRRDRRAHYDAPVRDRGRIVLEVRPAGPLRPIEIVDVPASAGPETRGTAEASRSTTERHATAVLARLPTHIAERELAVVRERLGFAPAECEVREVTEGGPANLVMLEVTRGTARELVTVFGEKGLRAELVAQRACDELARFLVADVPVGEHLADQLLLPLAVAGGGAFRTLPLSRHALTNIDTIRAFLDIPIRVTRDGDGVDRGVRIDVGPRDHAVSR